MSLLPLRNIWVRRNFGAGIFLLTILTGMLATSFIPVEYRATSVIELTPISNEFNDINEIISDINLINKTRAEEIQAIRSPQILDNISNQLNLPEREEFNIKLDKNRSLITKLTDKIKAYLGDGNNLTLKEKIINQINNELDISFTNDFKIYLKYTSKSPYVAKTIANISALEYTKLKSNYYSKQIIKKAELPNKFFKPNLKYAIYLMIIAGLITAIIASLYIAPKR